MGLGYETLRKIKADIIMASLSGYGATGPESSYVSYGPPQVALSGMASLTREVFNNNIALSDKIFGNIKAFRSLKV